MLKDLEKSGSVELDDLGREAADHLRFFFSTITSISHTDPQQQSDQQQTNQQDPTSPQIGRDRSDSVPDVPSPQTRNRSGTGSSHRFRDTIRQSSNNNLQRDSPGNL